MFSFAFCVKFIVLCCYASCIYGETDGVSLSYKIEGKVSQPEATTSRWLHQSRIMVNGGEHIGLLRSDGSFTVHDVLPGSYLIEVSNPSHIFDPIRVDINSKGKIRARQVNLLQTSQVKTLSYPLKFSPLVKAQYFQIREQWRITDALMHPMILTMVLPLVVLLILPKLMNSTDPEAQKELNEQMNFLTNPKQQMPEMSELLTSWFGGGGGSGSRPKRKAVKRPGK